MNSKPDPAVSLSKSPILSIDYRSGSVEMQLGKEVWVGRLPMSSADMSQINTPRGTVLLEAKPSSELPPASEG